METKFKINPDNARLLLKFWNVADVENLTDTELQEVFKEYVINHLIRRDYQTANMVFQDTIEEFKGLDLIIE